ncbi:hypothetical protein [Massilia phyllosphaerae]|uniref:hypothetical protein n=1 Tax=Massilia phyllosphaerae TaxID=3106034 RepID=UPI002B1CAF47|nr:hypothetical protein [Massilia sp. SGZ-792]
MSQQRIRHWAQSNNTIRDQLKPLNESTYSLLVRKANSAHTPRYFVTCMQRALSWLRPQLTTRTDPIYREIETLLAEIDRERPRSRVWHPPMAVRVSKTAEMAETARYVSKRDRVMALFEEANALHRIEPFVAAQEAFNEAQRVRASKPRKLDEETCKRIAKLYWDRKQDGTSYGLVKELAGELGVTATTIQNTVKKYKPNSIDK